MLRRSDSAAILRARALNSELFDYSCTVSSLYPKPHPNLIQHRLLLYPLLSFFHVSHLRHAYVPCPLVLAPSSGNELTDQFVLLCPCQRFLVALDPSCRRIQLRPIDIQHAMAVNELKRPYAHCEAEHKEYSHW